MSDLEHQGVRGMKWGVRKARTGGAATSKFLKSNFELSSEGNVFAAQILATSGLIAVAGLTKR